MPLAIAAAARLLRLAALAAALALAACASVPKDAGKNPADPFERVNRQTDEFNYQADKYVLKPVAQGYVKVVPHPVRDCVSNFFGNLGDVPSTINSVLQGKFKEAATDACRVLVNTTIGVGGCFDVARSMGLGKKSEDLGLTLGHWGFGPGPYIVIPLLGPSDLRDGIGRVGDAYLDPVSYLRPVWVIYPVTAVRFVDLRASLLQTTDLVYGAALDRYSFVRDAYLQRRRSQVYDGHPPPMKDDDDDSDDGPQATPAPKDQPAPPPAPQ